MENLAPRSDPPIKSICLAAPRNNNLSLNLVIENDKIWRNPPPPRQSFAKKVRHQIPLSEVIQKSLRLKSSLQQSGLNHVLAVVIANSALQLCGTPWLPKGWSKDSIRFMQTIQDEILPRPVISTQFDSNLGNHPFPEEEQSVHPNPDVLALGIVLLELFFGKPIEEYRLEEDLTPEGKVDVNTDYWAAVRLCDDADWDVHDDYRQAVKFCLNWNLQGYANDFDGSTLYQSFYRNVAWPLEKELRGYQLSVTELDKLLLESNQTKHHSALPKFRTGVAVSDKIQDTHSRDIPLHPLGLSEIYPTVHEAHDGEHIVSDDRTLYPMSSASISDSSISRQTNCKLSKGATTGASAGVLIQPEFSVAMASRTEAVEQKVSKARNRKRRGGNCVSSLDKSNQEPHQESSQGLPEIDHQAAESATNAGSRSPSTRRRRRKKAAQPRSNRNEFALFDDKDPRVGAAGHADQWFKSLREDVFPLLPKTPKQENRVKIAILDTGIDMTESFISMNRARITTQSFLLKDSKVEDTHGHGTHAAALLLRVARNADIFVARITEDDELSDPKTIEDVRLSKLPRLDEGVHNS